MAMHFTESAALLPLPAAKKLVLMAFADSADKDTRVAMPGFDTVLQWSGLKRSQAYDVVAELVEEGYLARRTAGRSGRRAEFYVFPRGGCCPLHGAHPDFVEQAAQEEDAQESGSGGPDPDSVGEQHGQVADDAVGDVELVGAFEQPSTSTQGSGSGSGSGSGLGRTPSRLPGSKNPPNPPDKPGGDCGCGRKRCRACGTSPRAARHSAAAAHAARLAEHQRRRDAVTWCGAYRCDRRTRRVFDAETGMPAKCPDCHPDVVVGPAPTAGDATIGQPA